MGWEDRGFGSVLGWVGEWYSGQIDQLEQTKVQTHETLGCVCEPQRLIPACGWNGGCGDPGVE